MVDATKTNRAWLYKQNEHDLLLQLQLGMQKRTEVPCILDCLEPASRHGCLIDKKGDHDCSTCISNWLNAEHK